MDQETPSRIMIQCPAPVVDGGPSPVKPRVGDRVVVEADIFIDGRDLLRAVVLYHPAQTSRPHRERSLWREAEMRPISAHPQGVRWAGSFNVDQSGTWTYTIEAWTDVFGTWRDELSRKVQAAQHLRGEMSRGIVLLREAADIAEVEEDRAVIEQALLALNDAAIAERTKYDVALAQELFAAVERVQPRHASVVLEQPLTIEVEP